MTLKKLLLLFGLALSLFGNTAFAAYETTDCNNIPQEIIFRKEWSYFGYLVVSRYERYGGGPFMVFHKNMDGNNANGPAHARNCSAGSIPNGTQVMTFKLKTINYFGNVGMNNGVAGHMAILARTPMNPNPAVFGFGGRGPAIWRANEVTGVACPPAPQHCWADLKIENYYAPRELYDVPNVAQDGAPLIIEDGEWYTFTIHVHGWGIAWWITEDNTGRLWTSYFGDPGTAATGLGYAFAPLCWDPNGSCSTPAIGQFEVHIKNLAVSWF